MFRASIGRTLAALGLAAASACAAEAQGVARDVAIRAVVPKYCTVAGRLGPVEVPFTIRVNAGDGAARPIATVAIPAVVCNTAADISVASVHVQLSADWPVVSVAAAPPVRPGWRATAAFGTATAGLDTATGTSTPGTTGQPTIGQLTVTVVPAGYGAALAPGSYSGRVKVVLSPR